MINNDWKKNKTYEEIYGVKKAIEIKRKMVNTRKGHIVTKETRRKIGLANSIALKGNKFPNKGKFKQGRIPWNKNLKTGKQKEATIKKRSLSMEKWHQKNKDNEKYKKRNKKISFSQLGDKNNGCGKNAREKNRIAHLGPKCIFWKGGISFEPYSVDWTETLRRAIKERDRFRCQLCSRDNYLVVHHIDYNKKNCDPKNLITLCPSCHSKTNSRRNEWEAIFKKMMT